MSEKLFKGKKALLIAEGCKISKEIKTKTDRLTELKEELKLTEKGTYINEAGDKLVISVTDKKSNINPLTVFKYLQRQKRTKDVWNVVKVQVTPLKGVVPEAMIKKWQEVIGTVTKFSFK